MLPDLRFDNELVSLACTFGDSSTQEVGCHEPDTLDDYRAPPALVVFREILTRQAKAAIRPLCCSKNLGIPRHLADGAYRETAHPVHSPLHVHSRSLRLA